MKKLKKSSFFDDDSSNLGDNTMDENEPFGLVQKEFNKSNIKSASKVDQFNTKQQPTEIDDLSELVVNNNKFVKENEKTVGSTVTPTKLSPDEESINELISKIREAAAKETEKKDDFFNFFISFSVCVVEMIRLL